MGCSQGAIAKLLVEPGASTHTFDASSERYDFLYEDIAKSGRLVGGRAITGTRSNYAQRMRLGHYSVGGRLGMYSCAGDLDLWLPRVLGGAESTDVFDVSDDLATNGTFGILINRVGGTFEYSDCLVNSCFWRGKAGPGGNEPELIEQVLDIMSLDEDATTAWPVSIADLGTGDNRSPYIMGDSTVTIGGTAYPIKDFVILVDNRLQPRWVNSLAPSTVCPGDRIVMLRVTMPFTASSAAVFTGIYKNASRSTGVTSTIVFAPSGKGYSTTFTFTGLQWVQTSPSVRGKREIDLVVDFVARKTGSASELVVTNDSTA